MANKLSSCHPDKLFMGGNGRKKMKVAIFWDGKDLLGGNF